MPSLQSEGIWPVFQVRKGSVDCVVCKQLVRWRILIISLEFHLSLEYARSSVSLMVAVTSPRDSSSTVVYVSVGGVFSSTFSVAECAPANDLVLPQSVIFTVLAPHHPSRILHSISVIIAYVSADSHGCCVLFLVPVNLLAKNWMRKRISSNNCQRHPVEHRALLVSLIIIAVLFDCCVDTA